MLNKFKHSSQKAFTLIELLVVISIIGILSALIVINLQDARARARDARKKQDMDSLKKALQLYYNDYQQYPQGSGVGNCSEINTIMGCGLNGTSCCPCSSSLDFAAGGSGCSTTYMASFPDEIGSSMYYYGNGNGNFCLKVTLENSSDSDITQTQSACSAACSAAGGSPSGNDYVVCSE